MLRAWAVEKQRLLWVILAGILAGWVTGYWAVSILVACFGYLLWHLRQLNEVTRWLKKGANINRIPDLSGAWSPVVRHVYAIQRRNRKRKEQMRTLLKRFEQVSIALPDGTVILRANNEIDWSNKVAGRLLGINYPKDRGCRIDNLIRSPEFHHYLSGADFSQPLNIASPVREGVELSIRIIPFGKNERLLSARDISTFSQVQTMRRDFVANVSHELRTPLTVIGGYLEAVLDDGALDEETTVALNSIRQQSDRMQHIVKDLLELSRLESTANELSETKVDMPRILSALSDEVKHILQLSEHELSMEVDENLFLLGGEKELTSVASNLIHNAIRHTPNGTKVWVKWFQNEQTGAAVFKVKDDGPGIEREHIPRLTERFYRLDKGRSRDVGGSGLGLSIIKHIMLRHGGDLKIKSKLDQGAEFTCTFPAGRIVSVDMPQSCV